MKKTLLTGLALGAALAFSGSAFAADLKLAVAGPVTGPNATFGKQLTEGAKQAVEDINKAGGILGQKLVLEIGDDASDPKQGVSLANKFAGEGVKLVLGHFNSGVTIPSSEVYKESGMLMITPSATNPMLTDREGYWNVFRTCGRDDQQGSVAAAWILSHFKGKNIAVVHDKTPYGKGLADATKTNLNKGKVTEVVYEGINTGEKDYSALVSKLKAANVDLVYFGGLHTEAGLIIRQMRDQGLNAPMMSGDGITDKEFAQIGGPGTDGTLMTFAPDPRKHPEAAKVVAAFKAKNYDPEAYTLYTYAALQIMAEAAKEAGKIDTKKMAEIMHSGKVFKTVIGDIAYDKKGDITRPDYVMYVWKKNSAGVIDYTNNEIAN
ncbi:general L-amino acid-binding protein [Rhizobiales bacterium GAS191]|jgi:branched-chain amino acid transport system substrate-binding protein|nr:general L-amino acid-binding protein [Rhizobiales bacterium GAS113]SEE23933.1 general L-amino acid-binding protein [Rhizobiales bacterium GAS188]SEE33529.1 general L-amino acid-binding protein [Rhizobiales bacterium GAS191]